MSSTSPPSPQEIQRKLSVHTRIKLPKGGPGHVSGTESDSDSIQTPDVLTPMGGFHPVGLTQPQLSSIAEARSGSGEDSDEDEPADSGWKTPDHRSKPRASGEDSTVLKSGYLWKKGERRKTWKKRWFVLRPMHLAYYKSSAEYQLLRLLDLSDIHSCTQVNLKRHDNTFGLISPNRTFYFQATSPEDVQAWVKAIEEARQTLLATSTQTSASTPIPIVRPNEPVTPQMKSSLVISSSPGQQHPVTSSDSEDGGQVVNIPSAALFARGGVSAPSPTAVNFLLNPTKPSIAGAATASNVANSGTKVILTGYLMKCGSKRRNWRKRWFVLTPEKLHYSGSHMDTKPHRVFPFTEILDALEYQLPSRHSHHHHATGLASTSSPPHGLVPSSTEGSEGVDSASHTFKIVTTKRNLLLCAPTEDDEIKWLGAIRALIARRSGSGVVPGKTSARQLTTMTTSTSTGAIGAAAAELSTSAAPNNTSSGGVGASSSVRSRTRRPSAGASDAEGRL